jgi:hypothetical protein
VDAHEDLADAWGAIIAAGTPRDLVDRLCAVPVSEAGLFELAKSWKTARLRQKVLNEWALKARERYRALKDEALRRGRGS